MSEEMTARERALERVTPRLSAPRFAASGCELDARPVLARPFQSSHSSRMGLATVLLFVGMGLPPSAAVAQDVWVRPHVRSDGTFVQGHYRSRPNHTAADNWSTYGNINPYTGEVGTRRVPADDGFGRMPQQEEPLPSNHARMCGPIGGGTRVCLTMPIRRWERVIDQCGRDTSCWEVQTGVPFIFPDSAAYTATSNQSEVAPAPACTYGTVFSANVGACVPLPPNAVPNPSSPIGYACRPGYVLQATACVPRVPATPRREDVARVLRGARNNLRACFERTASFVATFTLRSDGNVTDVALTSIHAPEHEVACARGLLRSLRFPQFLRTTFVVRFPFVVDGWSEH